MSETTDPVDEPEPEPGTTGPFPDPLPNLEPTPDEQEERLPDDDETDE